MIYIHDCLLLVNHVNIVNFLVNNIIIASTTLLASLTTHAKEISNLAVT